MHLFAKKYKALLSLILCFSMVFSQTDSLLIIQDELGLKDIHITKEKVAQNKISSASRSINNKEELPYTVYVVSGDEILKNGYFTLTDVLKQVPGFFVSQPGSAIHGEAFMVNGLYGNTHAKVMINGVPIKTYNASGLPIGEQLPIRQAERIEIIYGPSAVNVGADAGAASINIITRKSNRPIFVHADLSLGTQAYRSLNVLLGGKLGKDKNTIRFNAYGSASLQQDINIPTIFPFFDPLSYPLRPTSATSDSTLQRNQFPRSSRQFTLNLDYRSFHLSFTQMFRNIHSAVGSHPGAYVYENPFTTYGENINLINFTLEKVLKKFSFKIRSNFKSLSINEASSFNYNNPFVKQLYDTILEEKANGNNELFLQTVNQGDSIYFNDRRFAYGSDLEFTSDISASFFPIQNVEVLLGGNINILSGGKYTTRNIRPSNNQTFSTDVDKFQLNANTYARAYLKFEKVNFILGINRFYSISNINTIPISWNKTTPQVACLYKISPNLKIRASYSSSFLIPSNNWLSSNEQINKSPGLTEIRSNNTFTLNPQETKYTEFGISWAANKKLKTDASFFQSTNSNLLNFITEEDENNIYLGYDNSANNSSKVNGLKTSIEASNIGKKLDLSCKAHFSYYFGTQELLSGEILNNILAQPNYIGQLNLSFKIFQKLYINTDQLFVAGFASRDITSVAEYEQQFFSVYYAKPVWTMNLGLSIDLNNNFNLFFKGYNFNNFYIPGIEATGSPDDLSPNIQRDPYLITGVSYTLD